jgi:hypothetical protein
MICPSSPVSDDYIPVISQRINHIPLGWYLKRISSGKHTKNYGKSTF